MILSRKKRKSRSPQKATTTALSNKKIDFKKEDQITTEETKTMKSLISRKSMISMKSMIGMKRTMKKDQKSLNSNLSKKKYKR